MPEFNLSELLKQMVETASDELGDAWEDVKDVAEREFSLIARNITTIQTMKANGELGTAAAQVQLRIQLRTARAWVLTLKGISIIEAEKTANAVIEVIKQYLAKVFEWVSFPA